MGAIFVDNFPLTRLKFAFTSTIFPLTRLKSAFMNTRTGVHPTRRTPEQANTRAGGRPTLLGVIFVDNFPLSATEIRVYVDNSPLTQVKSAFIFPLTRIKYAFMNTRTGGHPNTRTGGHPALLGVIFVDNFPLTRIKSALIKNGNGLGIETFPTFKNASIKKREFRTLKEIQSSNRRARQC